MFTEPLALGLLVVCLTVLTQTDAVTFEPCGGSLGRVVAVDIKGCPASGVCNLKRGQQVSFSLRFTSRVPLQGITAVASAEFRGAEIDLPGSGQLACSNIQPACSNGVSNVEYTYSRSDSLPSILPPGAYQLSGRLFTASGDLILCAKTQVRVGA